MSEDALFTLSFQDMAVDAGKDVREDTSRDEEDRASQASPLYLGGGEPVRAERAGRSAANN